MKMKITKRTIDSAKTTGKDYTIWDEQIPGYGLRITKKGAKSYIIKYRNRKGVSRLYTLGKHGHLTPDMARDLARQELGRIATGADPAEERKTALGEATIKELCDLYLKEGCKDKKETTIYTDKGRIERHIKPLLGRKKISEVTQAHVRKMMHDIADGKTQTDERTDKKRGRAIVRGGKGTAKKAVALLSAIYTFAIGRGLIKDNPCRGVKKFPDNKNERFLSPKEFKELATLLKEAEEHDKEHPSAINAIRMLVFTGCRKSEILELKWDHIDVDNSCLRLPSSKTGAKVVRIGPPALALLQSMPREKDNEYVFTGHKKGKYFVGLTKVWHRIRKKKENFSDLRLHDLRHSFASIGVSGGLSLPLIGALLGHKNPSTTARYSHLADDPVKAAVDRITSDIENAMQGNSADIVSLEKTRPRQS